MLKSKNQNSKNQKNISKLRGGSTSKKTIKKPGFFSRIFRGKKKSVKFDDSYPNDNTIHKASKPTKKQKNRWWQRNKPSSTSYELEETPVQEIPPRKTQRAWSERHSTHSINRSSSISKNTNSTMLIKHFWYSGWPDHGAPDDSDTINKFKLFIKELLTDIRANPCNTVIHCSAGVGRTGTTYVVLKICLENNIVDLTNIEEGIISYKQIAAAITRARVGRQYMVQSLPQLNFICELFNAPIPTVNFKEIGIEEWGEKQVVTFDGTKPIDNKTNFSPLCRELNRYRNIVPWNDNNVRLPFIDGNLCSTYLNASYIESNKKNKFNSKVIATDCPKVASHSNFLRMLRQEKIGRIIMVTNLVEGGEIKCDDYTISDDEKSIGEHDNNKAYGAADIYELSIDNKKLKYVKSFENIKSSYENTIIPSTTSIASKNNIHRSTTSYNPINLITPVASGTPVTLFNNRKKIKSLTKFINIYTTTRENMESQKPLTFCDCKIILLYIFINKLLPDKIDEISNLLIQKPVKGTYLRNEKTGEIMIQKNSPKEEQNGYLIKQTITYIEELTKLQNLEFNIIVASCSEPSDGISHSLINARENYEILFKGDAIDKIKATFEENGSIRHEIERELAPYIPSTV